MEPKILLVDDNEATNFLHNMTLEMVGFTNIDIAENGLEACQYLEKSCPSVIFLDLNMPIMDGWEFLEEKDTNNLCESSNVVIVTSSTLPEDEEKASKFSCVFEYVEKPLTEEKVKEIVEKVGFAM